MRYDQRRKTTRFLHFITLVYGAILSAVETDSDRFGPVVKVFLHPMHAHAIFAGHYYTLAFNTARRV